MLSIRTWFFGDDGPHVTNAVNTEPKTRIR